MNKKYIKKDIVKKNKKIEFRVSNELYEKIISKLTEEHKTPSKLFRHLAEVYTSV